MTRYAVADWYATIQGEGRWTGTPVRLLRLQGCSVGCPWCDTRETWGLDPAKRVDARHAQGAVIDGGMTRDKTGLWAEMDAGEIVAELREMRTAATWVLLTGGEPAEQDLAPLAAAIRDAGWSTMLETSGTAYGYAGCDFEWVTVSPKLDMPGGRRIDPRTIRDCHEIKMVVGRESDVERYDALLDAYPPRPGTLLSVQPVSQSRKATQLCLKLATVRGWTVSLQTHKFVAVP